MWDTPIIIGADPGREGQGVEEVDISKNPSKPISRPPSAPRLLDLSTTSPEKSVASHSPENDDLQIIKSNDESSVGQTPEKQTESRTTSNEDLDINSASKMKINEELTIRSQDARIAQSPEGIEQLETEKLIVGGASSPQDESKHRKNDGPMYTSSENPTQNRKFAVNSKSNADVVIVPFQDLALVPRTDADEEKVANQISGNTVTSSYSNNALSYLNQIDPIAEGSYGFIVDGQSVRFPNITMVEPRSNNMCPDLDVDGANVDKVPYIIKPITKWSLEAASGTETLTNSNERSNTPRAKSATDVLEVREFKHLWMITPEPAKTVPTPSEESMIERGVIPIAPETASGNEQDTTRPPSVPVTPNSVTEPTTEAAAATNPSAPVVLPNLSAAMDLIVPALRRNSWLKEPKVTVPDDTGSVQTSRRSNVSKETATAVVSESLDQPGGNLTKRTSDPRTQKTSSKSKDEPSDQNTDSGNTIVENAASRSQTPSTSDEKSSSHSMIARGITSAKHVYDMLSLNRNLQIPTVAPLPLTPVPSPAPRRRRDPESYWRSTSRTPPPRQQDPQRPRRPRGYEGMPPERRSHRRSDGSRRRSGQPRPPTPLPANRPRRERQPGPPRLHINCSRFLFFLRFMLPRSSHYLCSYFTVFPVVGTQSD